jgi:hypothetical protein
MLTIAITLQLLKEQDNTFFVSAILGIVICFLVTQIPYKISKKRWLPIMNIKLGEYYSIFKMIFFTERFLKEIKKQGLPTREEKYRLIDTIRFKRNMQKALGNFSAAVLLALLFWIIWWMVCRYFNTNFLQVIFLSRVISGFCLFWSVFCKISNWGYMDSGSRKGYVEELSDKFWAMLYMLGMSLLFFSYIIEMLYK